MKWEGTQRLKAKRAICSDLDICVFKHCYGCCVEGTNESKDLSGGSHRVQMRGGGGLGESP